MIPTDARCGTSTQVGDPTPLPRRGGEQLSERSAPCRPPAAARLQERGLSRALWWGGGDVTAPRDGSTGDGCERRGARGLPLRRRVRRRRRLHRRHLHAVHGRMPARGSPGPMPTGASCHPSRGCEMGRPCAPDEDCADEDACTVNEHCDPAARASEGTPSRPPPRRAWADRGERASAPRASDRHEPRRERPGRHARARVRARARAADGGRGTARGSRRRPRRARRRTREALRPVLHDQARRHGPRAAFGAHVRADARRNGRGR